MTAYAIFNLLEVTDPDALEEYLSGVGATIDSHGGRVLASDPGVRVLEGDWSGIRNVIIEFPDMDAVESWYKSDDYKPLLEMRLGAARGNFIAVNGI